MRYVIVLLIGALMGAMLTLTAVSTLRQSRALPDSVMALLSHHLDQVRNDVVEQRCTEASAHFNSMLALAGDVEPLFLPSGGDDVLFARYADQLRQRIGDAIQSPATECRTLTEQLGRVGDGCKACHRDFKSS
jgi:hypothetical protein